MLKLYYAPGTVSIAVAIALEEAGLAHEAVKLDFRAAEQTKPGYLALNPKGRVPALGLADGTILTETGALLDYIAATAPDAALMPADALDAAHVRAVMYYLASTMHVAHAHKMRGTRWADRPESHADMTAKVPQTMAACAAYVEENALMCDFVAGDSLSLADPYLYIVCNWLEGDGVPLANYPQIAAFMQRMAERPSVKAMRERGML